MQDPNDETGIAGPPAPRANRRLTELALAVARSARPLLPRSARLILAVEANEGGEIELVWWRQDFRAVARLCASPEGFCPPESDEGTLQLAANNLLAYLAGRWPIPPRRLGIVTDGSGIAFAPDHPAPSAPGWLLRHAGGAGMLHAILPLDPAGSCAILYRNASVTVH